MKRLAAAIAIGLCATPPVSAQTATQPAIRRITITGKATCGRCRIELLPVATIGGAQSGDELSGEGDTFYAIDSKGRIFIADKVAEGIVQMFDTGGRKLARLGKPGSGPGEFRHVNGLQVGAGDSIHVYDAGNARHSVLAPGTGKYVRANPWVHSGWGPQYVRLGNLTVVNELKSIDKRGWLAFHIVDDGDRTLRSFGPSVRRFNGSNAHQLSTLAAGATPDRFLALHHWEYVIEEWTVQGSLLQSIARRADWFIPFAPDPDKFPPKPDNGPGYFMQFVWRDASGLIWVMSRIPDRAWRDNVETTTLPNGGTRQDVSDRNKYYDTMIEVIDPAAGVLIATQRFDRFYASHAGPGVLVSTMTDGPSGEANWFFVRPRLVRP